MVTLAMFRIIDAAATSASADLYVTSEPDISTPAGVHHPDVAVIDGKAARTAAGSTTWQAQSTKGRPCRSTLHCKWPLTRPSWSPAGAAPAE